MTLIHNPLKTLATVGTSIAAVIMFTATPSVAEDRDALPISPPTVSYPTEMAAQGITANCEAIFAVSRNGIPEDITAECTHPGFVEEVIKSAGTLRFEPKIENGKPVRRTGVVYPLIFQIDDPEGSGDDWFKVFDRNGDGIITTDDAKQAVIDNMDLDGDNIVTRTEFETYHSKGN